MSLDKGLRPVVHNFCYEEIVSVEDSSQANGIHMSNGPFLEHVSNSQESIDKNVDYQGWLDHKKRKWKATLEQRKEEEHQFEEFLGRRVNKTLPHGRPTFNLIEELSSSLLEKQFREAYQAMTSEDPPHANYASVKVEYVRTIEAGEKQGHSGPTVAVIECPNIHAITSAVRALDDYPCITALGWQGTAGKIAMQRCAASSKWFKERILLSRYAHVPIGNFELDWLLFIADTFFSRALRDQQQILWTSDDGIPDLGGTYEGTHALLMRCSCIWECVADVILQHLYRWLCSPMSKLHDPALHRVFKQGICLSGLNLSHFTSSIHYCSWISQLQFRLLKLSSICDQLSERADQQPFLRKAPEDRLRHAFTTSKAKNNDIDNVEDDGFKHFNTSHSNR
ncbi:hypothetical protein HPP92_025208 [Vanilla planifolia]|uniref:DNA polymerase epsilon catalytic subunit n=1 Tax=Vanilla planifolia TaxID=51239 RepID=A0A835U7J1_VANPL|nr:hypothetical protein HPP92_025208 [Vanilla planifolia]